MRARTNAAIILAHVGYVSSVGRFSYREDDNKRPERWESVKQADRNEWQKWEPLNVDSNECGRKKNKQSPIDLIKNSACESDHEMLFVEGTCELADVRFEIKPYSLKGTYPRDHFLRGNCTQESPCCTPPALDLSDSFHARHTNAFELKVPGEHTINGTRYDAELQFSHLDHVDEEYRTNRDNLIAMTSRLLRVDGTKNNRYIEKFLQHWEEVAALKEEECSVGRGITSFFSPVTTDPTPTPTGPPTYVPTAAATDPPTYVPTASTTDLPTYVPTASTTDPPTYIPTAATTDPPTYIPTAATDVKTSFVSNRRLKKDKTILHAPFRNQYYYGYKGSLTIPPCSDIVLWYVVDKPMEISRSQLARMKKLIMNHRDDHCRRGTYANFDGHVNRPLQPLNDRDIFHCDESDYSN